MRTFVIVMVSVDAGVWIGMGVWYLSIRKQERDNMRKRLAKWDAMFPMDGEN